MAQLLKVLLVASVMVSLSLLGSRQIWACWGGTEHGPRFDPALGVVDTGDWGQPYMLDLSPHTRVVAATYDDQPTLAAPATGGEPYPAEHGEQWQEGDMIVLDPGQADPREEEGTIISLIPKPGEDEAQVGPYLPSEHVLGYNTSAGGMTWIPASDDDFGWFSFEDTATLRGEQVSGLVASFSFHFLNGPVRTEMPPRLFDFVAGYQRREWIRPNVGWDVALRIGVFSDFEGSADEGMRFPSHLVTFWRLTPTLTALAGVDYLDWDEITILPVFGFTWVPTEDYRVDVAFPRPRAAVRIMESDTWVAIGGELAGGTWAIERDHAYDDNVTYQDIRLFVALETFIAGRTSSSLEVGYVFERDLEYRSGVGNYSPSDTMMIRWTGRH